MGKIQTFRDLVVWKEAHKLAVDLHAELARLPLEERYNLKSQMSRASVSISSNIAEGFGKRTFADKLKYYYISQGSSVELQNQLLLCKDLHYIEEQSFNVLYSQCESVLRLLQALINTTRKYKQFQNSF